MKSVFLRAKLWREKEFRAVSSVVERLVYTRGDMNVRLTRCVAFFLLFDARLRPRLELPTQDQKDQQ